MFRDVVVPSNTASYDYHEKSNLYGAPFGGLSGPGALFKPLPSVICWVKFAFLPFV